MWLVPGRLPPKTNDDDERQRTPKDLDHGRRRWQAGRPPIPRYDPDRHGDTIYKTYTLCWRRRRRRQGHLARERRATVLEVAGRRHRRAAVFRKKAASTRATWSRRSVTMSRTLRPWRHRRRQRRRGPLARDWRGNGRRRRAAPPSRRRRLRVQRLRLLRHGPARPAAGCRPPILGGTGGGGVAGARSREIGVATTAHRGRLSSSSSSLVTVHGSRFTVQSRRCIRAVN